ncbi:MAG: cupredoxin domain-containing protein [Candidatus Limnocylindrales bacterium]
MAVRLAVTFGAVLALALVSGCGGSGGGTATATPAGATPAAAAITCNASGQGSAVAISNFAFNPASGNAAVNGFVTWTNADSTSHTVSFDNGPDCGTVSGGSTTTAQFTVAGSYSYHCKIHPTMKGTIVVG